MAATEQQLFQILQQYPNAPPDALQQLERVVSDDDRRSSALLAWMYGQQGNPQRGAEITLGLLDTGGVAYLPFWLGQTLLSQGLPPGQPPGVPGQPSPELRRLGIDLLRRTGLDSAGVDPFALAQQAAAQGDQENAIALLDAAIEPRPPYDEPSLSTLLQRANERGSEIRAAAEQVVADRDRALHEIEEARRDTNAERQRLADLVRDLGGLASNASSVIQARDYGLRAERIEKSASRYTTSTIALGITISLVALVLGVIAAFSENPLDAALEKLPITIPFLILNVYIGRLALHYRNDATRLRHIELQIRAAIPFLEGLDEGPRKAVLAMLALRFFPGQALPDAADTTEPPDMADALGTLLSGGGLQKPRSQPDPAAEAPAA